MIDSNDSRKISTSVIARELRQDLQTIFQKLSILGLIVRNMNKWELTDGGKSRGAFYVENNYGRHIVWPESIKNELAADLLPSLKIENDGSVKVSSLGKYYAIPPHQINSILADLGRIKKNFNGWALTEVGKNLGGVQDDTFEGHTYVRWPSNITTDEIFITKMRELKEKRHTQVRNKHILDTVIESKRVVDRNASNILNPPTDMDELKHLDAKEFKNVLVSFDRDHAMLFSQQHYIAASDLARFVATYGKYQQLLKDDFILQYLKTNAITLQIDDRLLNQFIMKMRRLEVDIEKHNNAHVDMKLLELKYYFDHIMDDIDRNIKLDDEQRRAVITDDNHCLLVAGAGAGKTTTMAAKVKYLVEKQNVSPQDIIVISYTNKAVNELKERINKHLKIPAKVTTFHSFAFEIIRKAQENPPDVNFTSYDIIYDMLAKEIFDNKQLMKNLVLFMGYYFDLPDDIYQFKTLNEYHIYKSAMDYETLKSGLGEYVKQVAYKRSKAMRTLTGEFLRSIQEVQIANFLYLHGIDYVYEKPYPYLLPGAKKKYTPDFLISQGENEAYLEHYSLTESMRSFLFTPKEVAKYQKSIADKRALHQRQNTKLIETLSVVKNLEL